MLTGLLALGAGSTAHAELKIGVVEYTAPDAGCPAGQGGASTPIRTEFAPREREHPDAGAVAEGARGKARPRTQATMTEVQRTAAEKELRDGYRDAAAQAAGRVQDDFNARRNEEMSKLQRVLIEEVGVYAKAQGYRPDPGRRRDLSHHCAGHHRQHPDRLQSRRPAAAARRLRHRSRPPAAQPSPDRETHADARELRHVPGRWVSWRSGSAASCAAIRELRVDSVARSRRRSGLHRLPRQSGLSRALRATHAWRGRARPPAARTIARSPALVHANPHATFARIASAAASAPPRSRRECMPTAVVDPLGTGGFRAPRWAPAQ